jgi:hypothetical protein
MFRIDLNVILSNDYLFYYVIKSIKLINNEIILIIVHWRFCIISYHLQISKIQIIKYTDQEEYLPN